MTQHANDPVVMELSRDQRDKLYAVLLIQKQEVEYLLKDQEDAGNEDMVVYYRKRLDEIQECLNLF